MPIVERLRMPRGEQVLLQGNIACSIGSIMAGMRFFAGYPITPSSEIAEYMSGRLPEIGGKFIQMEDEIASIAAIIGASVAGLKSMTATSGPGFSLMQENIGLAYITETPIVIVNVQRGGPSTGLPTLPSQSDTMQTRWGTHGDYTAVAVAPSSVYETIVYTIKAFNYSEYLRTPVIILLDEIIAHMRENVVIPKENEYEIIERLPPDVPPEKYKHSDLTQREQQIMATFGKGYRFHVESLTHDEYGFTTSKPEEVKMLLDKLRNKIMNNYKKIVEVTGEYLGDSEILLIAYGSSARASRQVVLDMRAEGKKVGLLQLMTIWPFPDEEILQVIEGVKDIIVVEMNMGQLVNEVKRVVEGRAKVHSVLRYDGQPMTPEEIIEKIYTISK